MVSVVIILSSVLYFIIFRAYLTSVEALILIFKHATLLRLSGLEFESALTQAERDYREGNVDLKIQEHLTGSSEDSDELSASFIIATDIAISVFS
ncbi:hypothetical protein EDB87DRAFT_1692387 [Lactarius vividus]|nr:hypothetical protein EDB87DRAFT_1692387 [Lactarius vividus]